MNASLALDYVKRRWLAAAQATRFGEVDALRGVAIVMMVVYHFVYDLYFFGITDMVFTNPFWFYFQRVTASTFIVLVGLSLAISYQRSIRRRAPGGWLWWRYVQRGARIFGWGLVISLVTYLALGPRLFIRFGILHFIGTSVALAYPFLRFRWLNVVLGILLTIGGKVLQRYTFDLPWLVWLGFEPANHVYVDYFPMIPWFGAVLFGIAAGNMLFRQGERAYSFPDLSRWKPIGLLEAMGRRSLPIYLLHQPILFAILIPILWLLGLL